MTFDPQFFRVRYEMSEQTYRITDKSVIWEASREKDTQISKSKFHGLKINFLYCILQAKRSLFTIFIDIRTIKWSYFSFIIIFSLKKSEKSHSIKLQRFLEI